MEDILEKLRIPFPPAAISWLPGSTNGDKTKCMAMAYADLREYMQRLDDVCGLNWSVTYTPWGERIVCHLTINGVTRSSVGEMDNSSVKNEIGGTVAEAQAFKRAGAMFGLGRYLYNLPSVWVEFDDKKRRITDSAVSDLNMRYQNWYAKQQTQAPSPVQHRTPAATATNSNKPEVQPAPAPSVDSLDDVEESTVGADVQPTKLEKQAAAIITEHNLKAPPMAQAWACKAGHCANEHESRNSWKKVVDTQFGGKVAMADMPKIIQAFVVHQLNKQPVTN